MSKAMLTLTNGAKYKLRFRITDSEGRRWMKSGDILISVPPWPRKRAETRKPQGRARYQRRYANHGN